MNPDVKFNLEATLSSGVGDVQEPRTIDLLPSSLDLIDRAKINSPLLRQGSSHAVNPWSRFGAVKSKLDDATTSSSSIARRTWASSR